MHALHHGPHTSFAPRALVETFEYYTQVCYYIFHTYLRSMLVINMKLDMFVHKGERTPLNHYVGIQYNGHCRIDI